MTYFICPECGSKYFLVSRTGRKIVFHVAGDRTIEFVQETAGELCDTVIDTDNICCGACSWQGRLDEVVESQRD
jgi:hypothetical protein